METLMKTVPKPPLTAASRLAARNAEIVAESSVLAEAIVDETRGDDIAGSDLHIARIGPNPWDGVSFSVYFLGGSAQLAHHYRIRAADIPRFMFFCNDNLCWCVGSAAFDHLIFELRARFTVCEETARGDIEDYAGPEYCSTG